MRAGGGSRRAKPTSLPPLEGGGSLPTLEGNGRADANVTAQPLTALRLPGEHAVSPRWQPGGAAHTSSRQSSLEPLPALVQRGETSRGFTPRGTMQEMPPPHGRELPPLEPLGRDLPQLDPQAVLPPVAGRSSMSFGARRRVAPAAGAGKRLAPLQAENHPSGPHEPRAPPQELRPSCPWRNPSAPSAAARRARGSTEAVDSLENGAVSPEPFDGIADVEDLDRERVASLVLSQDPALDGIFSGEVDVPTGDERQVNRSSSSASSTFGMSARAEVEKAVHNAFLEECGRGSSPTAAAAEAIRRCRSSISRGSVQDGREGRAPFFNDSHQLLLKEGEDAMGVTA